jgi:hypothetical protein
VPAQTIADVADEVIARGGDGKDVATAQAEWMRAQKLLESRGVVEAVRKALAEITHCGAAEARRVLDELQREADAHPEGAPGHMVAAARLRFDALMRANVQ